MRWRDIVLEVMVNTKGEVVRLRDLYRTVHRHPEAKRRAATNVNVEPKIRQQLRVLRDEGLVERIAPGEYRLTAAPPDTSRVAGV